jgi:hypothetical protein
MTKDSAHRNTDEKWANRFITLIYQYEAQVLPMALLVDRRVMAPMLSRPTESMIKSNHVQS